MDNRNVLIAFNGSASSFKAVDYVGTQFTGIKDMTVTLFYVVPNVPPQFWDDGHILSAHEKKDRQAVIDRWFDNQKKVIEPYFEKAGKRLVDKFLFDARQIETRLRSDVTSVAEAMIEEARQGPYRTLVLGRGGSLPTLAGSLSADILHKGIGLAVCIVE